MNLYKGANNSNWKGGRSVNFQGYVFLWSPDHPHKNKDNQVAEHRLIVESVIGRYLKPSEIVHHTNEKTGDNKKSNLVACENNTYHMLLHKRMRAYNACGDPNAKFCRFCGIYDDLENLFVSKSGRVVYHRSCNAKNQMEYKKSKESIYISDPGE